MSISDYLDKMKSIQKSILDFFENQEKSEEYFQNLNTKIEDFKIHDDSHLLRMFLHILIKISNNHIRQQNFWEKMERLLRLFKKEMLENFSNNELFNIFDSNKRLLLYLIEEKIITINNYIAQKIITKFGNYRYHQYFAPEIKPFLKMKKNEEDYMMRTYFDEIQKELPENFYQNRKNGENEEYICELIRTDSIKEFIIYVNKNSIKLNSKISLSIFETNEFFLKNFLNRYNYNMPSLIEYATFYGSIQIFKYLQLNRVELTSSLWLYAIHGNNPEIIHILEENQIQPINNDYLQTFIESIKCYYNDLSNYFINNYLQNYEDKIKSSLDFFEFYNFNFIENEMINKSSLYSLCKYDYYEFLNLILKNSEIDINQKIKGSSLLYIACKNDNLDIVKALLNHDEIDVNKGVRFYECKKCEYRQIRHYEKTKSPLEAAVKNDNIEIVKILIENKKIDVNSLDIKIDSKYPDENYYNDQEEEEEKENKKNEDDDDEVENHEVNEHDLIQMLDLIDDDFPYNDGGGWPDDKYFPSDVLGNDCSDITVIINKLFQIKFFN